MFITNNHDSFTCDDMKILLNIKMSQNIMTRIVAGLQSKTFNNIIFVTMYLWVSACVCVYGYPTFQQEHCNLSITR